MFWDFLFEDEQHASKKRLDWDQSVFDSDRFKNKGIGNWVDWEDVTTSSYEGDGFEHPNYDQNGEW